LCLSQFPRATTTTHEYLIGLSISSYKSTSRLFSVSGGLIFLNKMENVYGIGVANRYALFIDEEEGEDNMLAPAATTEPEKKEKKTSNKKEIVKKEDDKENQRTNPRYEGKRVLDARRAQDGPREERNNRMNQDQGPRRDVDDDNRGGRGRGGRGGRGMGRGRGDGAPRGGRDGRGGRREFERKSGDSRTGVKAEDKRGGGGKGNWGTMDDEMKAKEGDETAVNTSQEETEAREGGEEDKKEGEDEVTKEEEEPKQLTLDEWKALQTKKDQPKFNLRKAGEGSDLDPKWKKAAAYKKEKDHEDEDDEEEENYVYLQRSNRTKHLDINIQFADQQQTSRGGGRGRGRGGRGGRGEGRGGRGGGRGEGRGGGEGRGDAPPRRGGSRGGRGSQQYSLDDQAAFPALG